MFIGTENEGTADEEAVTMVGKPGIAVEEVEEKVMKNTLPIVIGTMIGFYLIYRLLGRG